MNKFSFLITFISLFVAIGMTDLLLSLHKLLRIRKEVKWYWLLMAWALIILLLIINMWFGIYHYFDIGLIKNSGGFVVLLLPIIFLLLSSFAILPDKPKPGLDLKDWYFIQKNYFFALLLLNFVTFSFVKVFQIGIQALIPLSIPIALMIILIVTSKQWIHKTITLIFLVISIFMIVNQQINLQ